MRLRKDPSRPYNSIKRAKQGSVLRRPVKKAKLLSKSLILRALCKSCCAKECLTHYTIATVLDLRKAYVVPGSEADVSRRLKLLVDTLHESGTLLGKKVCRPAFRLLLGVSRHKIHVVDASPALELSDPLRTSA